ncbi:MAG: PEP-CTERM sorting domain-containing protein [Deltaproteobacteria bacterium]|nr:PEP-CTERM sorting domain-containing protein [Deltaproteobacteria bacterium]
MDAGTYLLFEGQFQATNFGEMNWNYTWSLTVDSVPEPGSIVLLSAGLVMLGALTWPRRNKLTV